MSLKGCIAPFDGGWLGKKEKELRSEVNRRLDIVKDADVNLISNRTEAIALLLTFVDANAKQFVDFVNAI